MHPKRTLLSLLMLAAILLAGCGQQKPVEGPKGSDKKNTKNDEEGHGPGPHEGTVFDFGKYHSELCIDHAKKQATIYILDGNAKKGVPVATDKLLLSIKTPQFQVEMKAERQKGDPEGKSSRFVATHENFGKQQEFEGTLSGTIDGKNYLGDFKEEEHKHEKDK
jgi:predicted small lipoprotein YifL